MVLVLKIPLFREMAYFERRGGARGLARCADRALGHGPSTQALEQKEVTLKCLICSVECLQTRLGPIHS
jgi:hypothetical protein